MQILNLKVHSPPFAATVAAADSIALPGRPGLPAIGVEEILTLMITVLVPFVHRHQLQQTGEEKARQAARQLKEEQLRREDAEKRLQNAHRTEESLRKEVGTVYTALDSTTTFALINTYTARPVCWLEWIS